MRSMLPESGQRADLPHSLRADTGTALFVLLLSLGAYNVARTLVVPQSAHFVANVGVGMGVVAFGAAVGLERFQIGLSRAKLRSGIRLGVVVAASITTAVGATILIGQFSGFADERVDVSVEIMLLRVIVLIPIGTVLVEEMVFRGVLDALLCSRVDTRKAAVLGAAAFGMWHLVPVWASEDGAGLFDAGRWAPVAGTFGATFVAGLGFIWLRRRSGHLAAPILAHIATNSSTFAIIWIVTP